MIIDGVTIGPRKDRCHVTRPWTDFDRGASDDDTLVVSGNATVLTQRLETSIFTYSYGCSCSAPSR